MLELLESFPNRKIVLTGANDEQFEKFNLQVVPYEIFTLKHDPEKTDLEYYRKMLAEYQLAAEDTIYFEHDAEAVSSAESVGIKTHFWDKDERRLKGLEQFLKSSLNA